jgi:hypothetical protein
MHDARTLTLVPGLSRRRRRRRTLPRRWFRARPPETGFRASRMLVAHRVLTPTNRVRRRRRWNPVTPLTAASKLRDQELPTRVPKPLPPRAAGRQASKTKSVGCTAPTCARMRRKRPMRLSLIRRGAAAHPTRLTRAWPTSASAPARCIAHPRLIRVRASRSMLRRNEVQHSAAWNGAISAAPARIREARTARDTQSSTALAHPARALARTARPKTSNPNTLQLRRAAHYYALERVRSERVGQPTPRFLGAARGSQSMEGREGLRSRTLRAGNPSYRV